MRLERRLDRRPEHAALHARRAADAIDLEQLIEPFRSRLIVPAKLSPTSGSTPPTTLEPPPNGMTAASASAAQSSTATRSFRSGPGDDVGRVPKIALEDAHRLGNDLP